MNSILAKTKTFEKEEGGKNEEEIKEEEEADPENEAKQRTKMILSNMTVTAPLIELLIVNKQHGAYNAKCFMSTALQDVFY